MSAIMKSRYIFLAATLALFAAGCTKDLNEANVEFASTEEAKKILNSADGSEVGSILVRFNPEAEMQLASRAALPGATRSGISKVDILLDEVGGYEVKPVFVITDANREKVMSMGLHLWYELRFDNEADLNNVAKRLASVAEVQRVQFNETLKKVYNKSSLVGNQSGDVTVSTQPTTRSSSNETIPFLDNYKHYQWNLVNNGTKSEVVAHKGYAATIEADVNALPAWKLCKGDPSIVVAICDEGVMYDHEDLAKNFCINYAEFSGARGVDDDGNGYVDDIYGYNFTGTPHSEISWDVTGDTGHGTHVAGIVSAVNNNRTGISSIAGGSGNNDGVKFFSVQIFDGKDGTSITNVAKAFQYAADRGAHIIQCSWGYPAGDEGFWNDNEYRYYARAEADAIHYFEKFAGTDDGPIDGGLVIFAAGNDSTGVAAYPGAYKNCICVTSIGPTLFPAYYTNYGPGSDIGAPGGDVNWQYGGVVSTIPIEHSSLRGPEGTLIPYAFFQGTSMACPMVSGVAALGLSYAKQLGRRYTVDEFRSMLISSSNSFDPFFVGSVTIGNVSMNLPSYSRQMGSGYIDAHKLLLSVDGTPYVTAKTNTTTTIDLKTYFGEGIENLKYHAAEISDEDKAAVGITSCTYSNGALHITCTKPGCATITVSMLVGGDDLEDESKPSPLVISRKFVLIAKESVAGNNGWL